jgi:hypothetical protein
VNRSLSTMLRDQVKTLGSWDGVLPEIEFEFNSSVNRSMGYSPFQVLYGFNPRDPLDLLPIKGPNTGTKKMGQRLEELFDIYE